MNSAKNPVTIMIAAIFLPILLASCASNNLVKTQPVQKDSYLYIKSPTDLSNFDTVTYFFTHSVPSSSLEQKFKSFSDIVGGKNAFVAISPNTSIELYESLNTRRGSCEFPNSQLWPSLLFQDSRLKKCYAFNITDDQEVNYTIALGEIISAIKESRDLSKHEFKKNLENDLSKTLAEFPNLAPLRRAFLEFIEYLANKLYG